GRDGRVGAVGRGSRRRLDSPGHRTGHESIQRKGEGRQGRREALMRDGTLAVADPSRAIQQPNKRTDQDMAKNTYECMFLLDTNKVSGDVPAAQQQIHQLLERNQVEILASRPWDERRLAYPIKGQKKGLYYLTYFAS